MAPGTMPEVRDQARTASAQTTPISVTPVDASPVCMTTLGHANFMGMVIRC